MKKKPHRGPSPASKCSQPQSGTIQATVTFQWPEAEELLELAVQARRWREVVQDLAMLLSRWRQEARNPEETRAFRSVNMILRDYLADAGLTLQTHEELRFFRDERRKEHAKYWDELFKKANANWRQMMKAGAQTYEEEQTSDANGGE